VRFTCSGLPSLDRSSGTPCGLRLLLQRPATRRRRLCRSAPHPV